jgi:hypothetical protein
MILALELVMRIVAFVLVAFVFLIAIENYQRDSKVGAAEKVVTALVNPPATAVTALAAAVSPSTFTAVPAEVKCVHRDNGATVCGPVVKGGNKTIPSIFDQAAVAQPIAMPAPVLKRNPAQGHLVRNVKSEMITPKQVHTPPLPPRHKAPAAERTASNDAPKSHLQRDHVPAPPYDHKLRVRHSAGEAPRPANAHDEPPPYRDRQGAAPRYSAGAGLPAWFGGEPPPRTRTANVRRFENGREEPPALSQRPGAGSRYGAERGAPPLIEHGPPAGYGARFANKRERSPALTERQDFTSPRPHRSRDGQFAALERRTLELERELHSLRAERTDMLRHVERRNVGKRPAYEKSPPGYDRQRIVQPD